MTELKIGDKAPGFCLLDKDEKKVCLDDYRGKWVILYFYPKDYTSGCTLEAIDFTRHLDQFLELNAIVLGVSPDSCSSHRGFAEKYGLKIRLLSDPDHKVAMDYKVWRLKKRYGREYYGIVRTTYLIDPKGDIAYIWRNVKVKGHVEEVKNKLAELLGK